MTLTAYKPEYKDLWFKQKMLSDEETMSYNHAYGGTIPFPESRWKNWYDRWIVHSNGERYYRYLKDETGTFVGEISYHYIAESNRYLADVVIYAACRGKGYGTMGLKILCAAAKENGVTVLYDEIAIDNPSVTLFLKHGFLEESRSDRTVTVRKVL